MHRLEGNEIAKVSQTDQEKKIPALMEFRFSEEKTVINKTDI